MCNSSSSTEIPIWPRFMQGLCILLQSLWACMSVLLCLKSLLFLDSSIFSGFWNLSVSYFRVPELSGERSGRNIPLRTECSKGSHASNIIQVWAPFLSKRKLLCWWLNEILMYESQRRPLGSILLVHYQNSNMWLFLRYLAYSSPVLWWSLKQCSGCVPSHGMGLKYN